MKTIPNRTRMANRKLEISPTLCCNHNISESETSNCQLPKPTPQVVQTSSTTNMLTPHIPVTVDVLTPHSDIEAAV